MRFEAAKKVAGRAFGFVRIHLPAKDQPVTRGTFCFQLDKAKLKATQPGPLQWPRSNLIAEDSALLWKINVQLTQIELAFRTVKSEFCIRRIYHRRKIAPTVTSLSHFWLNDCRIENPVDGLCPGPTPVAVLEKLAAIPMIRIPHAHFRLPLPDYAPLNAARTRSPVDAASLTTRIPNPATIAHHYAGATRYSRCWTRRLCGEDLA